MPIITIANHDLTIPANPGQSLLNNFLINQAPIHTICGGKARCGCCRIKILSGAAATTKVNDLEVARLGRELIDAGWRLACQTHTLRDLTIYVPPGEELDDHCCEPPGP